MSELLPVNGIGLKAWYAEHTRNRVILRLNQARVIRTQVAEQSSILSCKLRL